jgi:hypothetical protein
MLMPQTSKVFDMLVKIAANQNEMLPATHLPEQLIQKYM